MIKEKDFIILTISSFLHSKDWDFVLKNKLDLVKHKSKKSPTEANICAENNKHSNPSSFF